MYPWDESSHTLMVVVVVGGGGGFSRLAYQTLHTCIIQEFLFSRIHRSESGISILYAERSVTEKCARCKRRRIQRALISEQSGSGDHDLSSCPHRCSLALTSSFICSCSVHTCRCYTINTGGGSRPYSTVLAPHP